MTSASTLRVDARQRRRLLVDRAARLVVGMGGSAVIVAIGLIFFYLLWVVLPLFQSSSVAVGEQYAVPEPAAGETLLLGQQDEGERAFRLTRAGSLVFFDPRTGAVERTVAITGGATVRAATQMESGRLVLLLDGDQLQLVDPLFDVSFDGERRIVTSNVAFPLGDAASAISGLLPGATRIDARAHNGALVLALQRGTAMQVLRWDIVEEGLPLDVPQAMAELASNLPITQLWLGARGETLFTVDAAGGLALYDTSDASAPTLQTRTLVVPTGARLVTAASLVGGYSALIADSRGTVAQWTAMRDASGVRLVRLREFAFERPVVRLASETGRKGFLAMTDRGHLHITHTTAQRDVADVALDAASARAITSFGIDRHGDAVLYQAAGKIQRVAIDNPHPEVSWHSLWQKVWYEGYSEPIFSWQSSAADDDFEPKFSLTPLAFGTLKGAFYALLFALPMAVLGAIYTAYFMAPSMRAWVKPGIEIMAALPTVILGFLAGLWLAPLVEANLMAVFALFLVLPAGILLLALGWHRLPDRMTRGLGQGWTAALLIVPLVALVWLCFVVAPSLEGVLFAGDLKSWMNISLGIDYDQRNCLVVGVAMGLAVIPTIFSIAEDAIYSVPRHLINGSLALGATPWQTLIRVVLLTASPGIFSAAMIGMGRAVGETMIVLMSTGNTPVMDFSIFQGMRTFAANIAVELPESAVGSTHYRVLFLAALVLFAMTFVVNTAAELVRQRLRSKYGNL